jgi:hypothetical protein
MNGHLKKALLVRFRSPALCGLGTFLFQETNQIENTLFKNISEIESLQIH